MRLFSYQWGITNEMSYGVNTQIEGLGFYYAAFYKNGILKGADHDTDSLASNIADLKLSNTSFEYVDKIPSMAEHKLIEVVFVNKRIQE
jgi:hypothetical protein